MKRHEYKESMQPEAQLAQPRSSSRPSSLITGLTYVRNNKELATTLTDENAIMRPANAGGRVKSVKG